MRKFALFLFSVLLSFAFAAPSLAASVEETRTNTITNEDIKRLGILVDNLIDIREDINKGGEAFVRQDPSVHRLVCAWRLQALLELVHSPLATSYYLVMLSSEMTNHPDELSVNQALKINLDEVGGNLAYAKNSASELSGGGCADSAFINAKSDKFRNIVIEAIPAVKELQRKLEK